MKNNNMNQRKIISLSINKFKLHKLNKNHNQKKINKIKIKQNKLT